MARAKLGWTAEVLAAAAGVTSRTVRKAENGGNVSASTATALAEALKIPVESILATGDAIAGRIADAGFAAPAPVDALVGREDDELFARRLLRASGTLCLAGPSGIGKSSLASAIVATFSQPVIWVASRERRGRRAASTLKRRLCAILDSSAALRADADEQEVDSVFRSIVEADRPILVLDDAASRTFVEAFASLPCPVIITTARRSVQRKQGDAAFVLAPLSDTATLQLLRARLGDARVDEASATARGQILAQLAGCPQAVVTAAAVLEREQFLPIGEYDGHWRDRWSADTASGSQRLSPAKLTLDAARCLSVLIDASTPRSLDEVSAVTSLDRHTTARALSELFDAYLCDEAEHLGRECAVFECPPAVRAVIWR